MEASEIRKMGDEVRGEDPGRAAELYRQASDLGDADASSSLGYMYIVGEGVPQDTVTAAEYLKRASDLGNTKAMCNLGSIMMGIDPSQALALFERAAESGYEKGMINAATMLRGGNGVAADPERAVMWLERAADTSTEAAGILAHILRTGEGVFPDKPRAAELYRRAAEAGDPNSMKIEGTRNNKPAPADNQTAQTTSTDVAASVGNAAVNDRSLPPLPPLPEMDIASAVSHNQSSSTTIAQPAQLLKPQPAPVVQSAEPEGLKVKHNNDQPTQVGQSNQTSSRRRRRPRNRNNKQPRPNNSQITNEGEIRLR